jgi:hypothetical protein
MIGYTEVVPFTGGSERGLVILHAACIRVQDGYLVSIA